MQHLFGAVCHDNERSAWIMNKNDNEEGIIQTYRDQGTPEEQTGYYRKRKATVPPPKHAWHYMAW